MTTRWNCNQKQLPTSVADPGFPRGGSSNPPGRGGRRQHTTLPNSPKNCLKLKEFGPGGGGGRPP